MTLIKLEEQNKEQNNKNAMFVSSYDLLKSFIRSWVFENLDLCLDMDIIISTIIERIERSEQEKSKIAQMIETWKLKRCIKKIIRFQKELQYLTFHIESLAGFNTLMKAGVKNKFKDKKILDDNIEECREISIMMEGILRYIIDYKLSYNFKHELEILKKISTERGFFQTFHKTLYTLIYK
jgi:hypothetical protein